MNSFQIAKLKALWIHTQNILCSRWVQSHCTVLVAFHQTYFSWLQLCLGMRDFNNYLAQTFASIRHCIVHMNQIDSSKVKSQRWKLNCVWAVTWPWLEDFEITWHKCLLQQDSVLWTWSRLIAQRSMSHLKVKGQNCLQFSFTMLLFGHDCEI